MADVDVERRKEKRPELAPGEMSYDEVKAKAATAAARIAKATEEVREAFRSVAAHNSERAA